MRNIIEYYIDGNRSKKILKQMKKISGSSNMERMLQYIENTYLKQSQDRVYKNRITNFLTEEGDFLILEQIKNNLKLLMDDAI